MKYLMYTIVFLFASCNATKEVQQLDMENAFLQFSKGSCLGNCQVYDLWLFENGSVVYNGIKNVTKKGVHKQQLSTSYITKISSLLKEASSTELSDIKGRDLQLTTLVFSGKKLVYQESNISGHLKRANEELNAIIDQFNK